MQLMDIIAFLFFGWIICMALSSGWETHRAAPSPSSGMGWGFLCVAILACVLAWLRWGDHPALTAAILVGFNWLLWIVVPLLGVLFVIGLILKITEGVRWIGRLLTSADKGRAQRSHR